MKNFGDHPSDGITDILESLSRRLSETFADSLLCLLLYGSWAKGTARDDSDVDLLAIFEKLDKETSRSLDALVRGVSEDRIVTVVPASLEGFQIEKNPLYTAVKREGIIILGGADLTIHPDHPAVKYSSFFRQSMEFEKRKVVMAEDILREHPDFDVGDMCWVAAKHAVQAALAMRGAGYSSKAVILFPLAEQYLGQRIADDFRSLFALYVRSEYGMEHLQDEEKNLALQYARTVVTVYDAYSASQPI